MVILFSISLVLVLNSVFFNKLLTLGILFSATVRSVVVVAKLVTLVILFLTLFFLTLTTVVVVAKIVILGISYLTLFILALRAVV